MRKIATIIGRRIVLHPMFCRECCTRWGATKIAKERPCPFCGSERTVTTLKVSK